MKTNPKCETKSFYYTTWTGKENEKITTEYKVYGPYKVKRNNIKIGGVVITFDNDIKVSIDPNKNNTEIGIYVHTPDANGNLAWPEGNVGSNVQNAHNQLQGGKNLNAIGSGEEFYIAVLDPNKKNGDIKEIEMQSEEVEYYNLMMMLLAGGNDNQNFALYISDKDTDKLSTKLKVPKEDYGNVKIIKREKDPFDESIIGRMPDVGFKIKFSDGTFVREEENIISYVSEDQATEFCTDENGEIYIEGLKLGDYTAIETVVPYDGFVSGNQYSFKIENASTTLEVEFDNTPKYVDLSGYVWVDNKSGKISTIDNLRNTNDDSPLEGVKVSLQYSGREVKATSTDGNGYYKFSKVDVNTLGSPMCIVFEYNGLKYTNVNANINHDNGSKAAENQTTRSNFNQEFSAIEGYSRNTGLARGYNNSPKWLYYNNDTQNHTSTLQGIDEVNKFPITAGTLEANYDLKVQYLAKKRAGKITKDNNELTNINLGLYIREQPDLALVKDIDNIRATINDYDYTYPYNQRFLNKAEYGDGFDDSVKYSGQYSSMGYTRAVYESDYKFENENDRSKELQLYVTYKIAIKNQSTTLTSKVNSIVDYYDNRYTLVGVGTSSEVDKTTRTDYIQH